MSKDTHHHFNYIELPSRDNTAMKAFYGQAFGWTFKDWGEVYVEILGAGVSGGFDAASPKHSTKDGVFVLLFSDDLDASLEAVTDAGGAISQPPYDFPGGRRFHFTDPSGNELGVWGLGR